MGFFNKRHQFGWLTILLHWLLFLLIAGLFVSGKYSDSLPRGEKIPFIIDTHKQIGIAVLVLTMFRLLWRLINLQVQPLIDVFMMRMLSFWVHWLLYLTVVVQAFGGIIMQQMFDRSVYFFGFRIPRLVDGSEYRGLFGAVPFLNENVTQLRQWHELGAHIILGLIAAHVLAALFHHFYLGNDTLRRMWFTYRLKMLRK